MQAQDGVEAPSSQYQGVTWDMQQKQYLVTVMTGRGSVQFGWYSDEEEAACAHDAAAVVIGPQAHLNFPNQVPFAQAKLGSVCASVSTDVVLSRQVSCLLRVCLCLYPVLCDSVQVEMYWKEGCRVLHLSSYLEPGGLLMSLYFSGLLPGCRI